MAQGLIVSSYGRFFTVEVDGKNYEAVTRGKKTEFVVGDQVLVTVSNQQQAQIQELVPRQNLVYRSDRNRSKIIASNLQQIIIVIAVKPNFNLGFLNSCLLSAESSQIEPLIVVNKMDLIESPEFATNISKLYHDRLGYKILKLSALENCADLRPHLEGKRSLLIGQSGMGKSTITNQVYPEAMAKTAEITKYETSGSHTTTNASLYHLNTTSDLIDCPGLQEFGLFHLDIQQIAEFFPEMRNILGQCKFSNCRHLQEPQCVIRAAAENGAIDSSRYAFYQRLTENLKTKKSY